MSFFVYRLLTPHKRRIRLIHLLPCVHSSTNSTADIFCTVSHASLDDPPGYTALSYHWGSLEQTHRIILDGQSFFVTANLAAALRDLQLPHDTRILWIDALCIDQDDEIEKNEQVQQMSKIFAQAEKVIAWLGPSAENSDIAVNWIVEYGTRSYDLGIGSTAELRLRNLLSRLHDDIPFPNNKLRNFLVDLQEQLLPADPTSSAQLCKALSDFVQRAYWSRIWVVQEMAHARVLIFMCGKAIITENAVHYALRLLRNFRQYVLTTNASLNMQLPVIQPPIILINTQNPINLLKSRRTTAQLPLMQLLRMHRRLQASDPRDKVFALLGLSSDAEALGVKVDYRRDCCQIYTDVAKKLLSGGFVEILSLPDTAVAMFNLPSWVPDWSLESRHMTLQQRGLDRSAQPHISRLQPVFSAGSAGRVINVEFKDDGTTAPSLGITARLIGKISTVGATWESGGVSQWLQDLEQFSYQVFANREDSTQRLRALCRTAVADQEIRDGSAKSRLSEAGLQRILQWSASKELGSLGVHEFVQDGLGNYCRQLQDIANARRPILVSGKYLGIGPSGSRAGDIAYVVEGSDVPYLFRPISQDGRFKLVGEVYIHGVMDGDCVSDAGIDTIVVQ